MTMMEILLDLLDNISAKETTYTYSFTAAEIIELIEVANNGYVIDELIADDSGLILTLAKSGERKIRAEYKREAN